MRATHKGSAGSSSQKALAIALRAKRRCKSLYETKVTSDLPCISNQQLSLCGKGVLGYILIIIRNYTVSWPFGPKDFDERVIIVVMMILPHAFNTRTRQQPVRFSSCYESCIWLRLFVTNEGPRRPNRVTQWVTIVVWL